MNQPPIFRRDVLDRAFNGDRALVAAFEELVRYVTDAAGQALAGAGAASVIADASLLTLSSVEGLDGARILAGGEGIDLTDDGASVTVSLNDLTPKIDGGFPATFIVTGETNLILPLIGTLATLADLAGAVAGSVTSFNTRTGAITLTSGDVTTALTFTPVTNARTISTTAPLTGGGDLSANRTFAITAASGAAAGSMSAADKTKLDAITGTNTGDQTSIVGITGTKAQFDTAVTDGNFLYTDAIGVSVQAYDADLDAVASSGIASAWTATNLAAPTSGTGAFTTVSAKSRHKQVGKIVTMYVEVDITTNGTAASWIDVTLPVASASVDSNRFQPFAGFELTTGLMVRGAILNNSAVLRIQKYDATYLGANGYKLRLSGVYEAA